MNKEDKEQYERDAALTFIFEKMKNNSWNKMDETELKAFITDCATQEDEYMGEIGVFADDPENAEIIYDEEDAFNFILSGLNKKLPYKKWKDDVLEDIIDDYLEYNYDYMMSVGIVE